MTTFKKILGSTSDAIELAESVGDFTLFNKARSPRKSGYFSDRQRKLNASREQYPNTAKYNRDNDETEVSDTGYEAPSFTRRS